ncbi:MAG: hypothetical protein GX447_06575 [Elusimicrobia bacterium]|nr:hypothetical protein [Elusimicrobiota bacterium]
MKKTLYLIDFCNFSHALFSDYWDKKGEHEKRAVLWLCEKAALCKDEFVLYLDGTYRSLGKDLSNMKKTFCEERSADEVLLEYALYCKDSGKRFCAVTDDGELRGKLEKEKIKVLSCFSFYSFFEKKD